MKKLLRIVGYQGEQGSQLFILFLVILIALSYVHRHHASPNTTSSSQAAESPAVPTNIYTPRLSSPSDHSDQSVVLQEFLELDIRKRIQFVNSIYLQLEEEWGSIEEWSGKFDTEWTSVQLGGLKTVEDWIGRVKYFIERGRRALGYTNRVMDGETVMALDEWFDVRELLTSIMTGVHTLEFKLNHLRAFEVST